MPRMLQGYDCSRTTILQFALIGLQAIGASDLLSEEKNTKITEWIKSLCIPSTPQKQGETEQGKTDSQCAAGYRGGSYAGFSFNPDTPQASLGRHDFATLASIYSSLVSLQILHPHTPLRDMAPLDSIASSLHCFQNDDGSFRSTPYPSDGDTRMCYMACAIAHLCGDQWSGLNRKMLVQYLLSLQQYDGGFSGSFGGESHSGYTFCALAALNLINEENWKQQMDMKSLMKFLLNRQIKGLNGRPNKLEDVCYSWWAGASIALLEGTSFIQSELLFTFIASSEDVFTGGIKKAPEQRVSDPLHSALGLMGMCVFKDEFISRIKERVILQERYRTEKDIQEEKEDWVNQLKKQHIINDDQDEDRKKIEVKPLTRLGQLHPELLGIQTEKEDEHKQDKDKQRQEIKVYYPPYGDWIDEDMGIEICLAFIDEFKEYETEK
ncbi:MAG: putative geranylgeranyltransferase beta subunit, partial [Streblomastix strix]